MKYYCKNCGSTYLDDTFDAFSCPACGNRGDNGIVEIPDYETVSQWEVRTGREYPNTAPVYVLHQLGVDQYVWCLYSYKDACIVPSVVHNCLAIIIATEAGAPPDDWRPEDEDAGEDRFLNGLESRWAIPSDLEDQ